MAAAHRSLWLADALHDELHERPAEPLHAPISADVCIVGGGFTGLWTAIWLKQSDPSLGIVIIDADICGSGASGRNGGFVMSWWSKYPSLRKVCGTDEAVRLAAASADAVTAIGRFCDEQGIDAHYHHAGWMWTATNPAQIDAWHETISAIERDGASPYQHPAACDVAARTGSPTHLAGVFEPSAATVDPGRLVRGLRRVAIRWGIRVFEHTPMLRIDRPNGSPDVVTPRGRVAATRVVLALNAWMARRVEYRPFVVVVASDVIATTPIPGQLQQLGWQEGLAVSDSRRLVNYYRTTDDGRVVFGKGGGGVAVGGRISSAFHRQSPREAELVHHLHRTYPQLANVPVERSWRGPIDYSLVGVPSFLRLDNHDDLVGGAGYSGNGVGPSYLGGRILAAMTLGRDDEWGGCGLTRPPTRHLPGEPARTVGGAIVSRAIARKERREDTSRRVDAVTRAIAALDPTSFVEASHNPPTRPTAATSQPR
jgi:putative aminophosphonate oxidoreductase